jgi:MULE transposase domain
MDSTHKTNQLEWKLFTIMVRDTYACWLPVAHALMSNEFGELIAEFLLVIKKWVTWNLRHVLTDDSAAEIKAFRLAFRGLMAGETEVSSVLPILISYLTHRLLDKPPSLSSPLPTYD